MIKKNKSPTVYNDLIKFCDNWYAYRLTYSCHIPQVAPIAAFQCCGKLKTHTYSTEERHNRLNSSLDV